MTAVVSSQLPPLTRWPSPLPGPRSRPLGDLTLDEMVAAGLEGVRRDWPQTPFTADLEPCTAFGSAGRLQIAVRNLRDNAAKFGPRAPR